MYYKIQITHHFILKAPSQHQWIGAIVTAPMDPTNMRPVNTCLTHLVCDIIYRHIAIHNNTILTVKKNINIESDKRDWKKLLSLSHSFYINLIYFIMECKNSLPELWISRWFQQEHQVWVHNGLTEQWCIPWYAPHRPYPAITSRNNLSCMHKNILNVHMSATTFKSTCSDNEYLRTMSHLELRRASEVRKKRRKRL